MTFEAIVDDYISQRRRHALAELDEFRKLRTLQEATRSSHRPRKSPQ